ncbi:Bifunctional protein GlmU [uncultured archaeon]|nr:Bifunctional protein GlmU [uncultured archaeon]
MSADAKVCILAAGIGSRMGDFTSQLNKALLPLAQVPVITRILNEFDPDLPVVMAVGHRQESLIAYLREAHPERAFEFVDVKPYTGPGSGPGFSLLCAKAKLQCPFLLTTVDTLVREKPPLPTENWVGVSPVEDTTRFCSFATQNGRVTRIDDKVKSSNRFAFIGLAGIHDYAAFWESLSSNRTIIGGEVQLSNGLQGLIAKGLAVREFGWLDTGTPDSYAQAKQLIGRWIS